MEQVEVQVAAQTSTEYKWTDADTAKLINWRASNEAVFTGRRNAAIKGFELFVAHHGMEGRVQPVWIKKKWENLKQKYKELKAPRTGVSTEGGEATAANWKWFGAMDGAMGHRPSITPPNLIASAMAPSPAAVASPSVQESEREREQTPRRKREPDLLSYLKDLQEKEEEREKVLEEKEDRKEREALEREVQRERERREEERQNNEKRDRETREWREWMDNRAREERAERETEHREKEERREREAGQREERLLSILQALLSKK